MRLTRRRGRVARPRSAAHNAAMKPRIEAFVLLAFSLVALLAACSADTPDAPVPASAAPRAEARALTPPAQPDSMAPRLSASPSGTIVLSWLEPDGEAHALRYSELTPSGWSAPATVASGGDWFVNYADMPSVVPVSDTLWAAHWLENRTEFGYAYDIHVALSTDRGKTWSRSVVPHDDDTDTQHGFVSMYSDGDGVGLVWLDGRKYINEVTDDVAASAMTLRGATIEPDLSVADASLIDDVICDCCQTDVAYSSTGPVAVYRDRTVDEIRDIYVTRRTNGIWLPGQAVHDDHWLIDGCPVNGPVIAAHGDHVAVAWFTGARGRARVEAAWSQDGGSTFAAPVDVGIERPLGHVGAELLANGDLVVSWLRAAADRGAELCLRRISPAGALGETHVLALAPDVFAFSVPQLALNGRELVVTWTNDVDDHTSLGSAAVPVELL